MTLPCGCPEQLPQWDGKDIDLGGEPMFNFPIATFVHMPMGYEVYLGRVRHLMTQLELNPRWPGLYLRRLRFRRRVRRPPRRGHGMSCFVLQRQHEPRRRPM